VRARNKKKTKKGKIKKRGQSVMAFQWPENALRASE
jgi:hypothetical protein